MVEQTCCCHYLMGTRGKRGRQARPQFFFFHILPQLLTHLLKFPPSLGSAIGPALTVALMLHYGTM